MFGVGLVCAGLGRSGASAASRGEICLHRGVTACGRNVAVLTRRLAWAQSRLAVAKPTPTRDRRRFVVSSGDEEAEPLEAVAHGGDLGVRRRRDREPVPAHAMAEQV